jgi:hypothetical protein
MNIPTRPSCRWDTGSSEKRELEDVYFIGVFEDGHRAEITR